MDTKKSLKVTANKKEVKENKMEKSIVIIKRKKKMNETKKEEKAEIVEEIKSSKSGDIVNKTSMLKLNQICLFPANTQWDIQNSKDGFKARPFSTRCLLDRNKVHDMSNCSCLIVDSKNKSIIKTCHSCQDQERIDCKKTLNFIINIFTDSNDKENSTYNKLVENLVIECCFKRYKREKSTGNVFNPITPYAYVFYKTPIDFLNEIFLGNKTFLSVTSNMNNMINFFMQYDHPDFPFIKYDKDYLGFKNGVLNKVTCEFIETSSSTEHEEEKPPKDLTVYKYFDYEFTKSIDTPLMDKVLDFQFTPDVRDFTYACLGRMFGIRDNFGFMLFLYGEPGTGKSVIINVLACCFDNLGSIGSTFEPKFGLHGLYDKDLLVWDDITKGSKIKEIFPQETFQTCVTGGKISIAGKNITAFTVDWTVPLLWAGNYYPSYLDKGQISRRMLCLNYEKLVLDADPSIKDRIIENELPAFIYKCLLYYKRLLSNERTKDIWHLCPEYFREQQQELRTDRNPFYKFLFEYSRYKEGKTCFLEEVRTKFKNQMEHDQRVYDKKIGKLDHGTFSQVNKKYIISKKSMCKNCLKSYKLECCAHSQKTTKEMVSNFEFIDNLKK
jgi:hypothetical protein